MGALKWSGTIAALTVGLLILLAYAFVFLEVVFWALPASLWGLIYGVPVLIDLACLLVAVLASRLSGRLAAWNLVRNLAIAVWSTAAFGLFYGAALASSGHWPGF